MELYHTLSHFRTVTDLAADQTIENLVSQMGLDYLRQNLYLLSDYQTINPNSLPIILQEFIAQNSTFPENYHKKEIVRACEFYQKNSNQIGLILGLYALPYCYLGADGAKVLCFTNRIKNDTYKRLKETGEFLKAVMKYDNWHNHHIFTILAKVRLLHAAIRYFILKSGRWDAAWGQPINQEDMLGTNLAFSLIVIRGMEKLGNKADTSQQKAYLTTWNYIGFLMGIDPQILPQTIIEANKIDQAIAKRQFRPSAEGQELTASLLKVIKDFAPNPFTGNLLQAQSRFLIGKDYSEMLGIKETNVPESVLKLYNESAALIAKLI